MAFIIDTRGQQNSKDYRIYVKNSAGEPISPWHDIPLFANQSNRTYHMVVEIPRWSCAKMEVSTKESLNPIKHEVRDNGFRYIPNVFPQNGCMFNYGSIPQTWENPQQLDKWTNCKGDNDPMDVIEIGSRIARTGDVLKVKVLGVVAVVDEEETDWKVITIDVNDSLANSLEDIDDVDRHMPGLLICFQEWFRSYKITAGKTRKVMIFVGEVKDRAFAENLIAEKNRYWKEWIDSSETTELNRNNTSLANNYTINNENANKIINQRQESMTLETKPIEDQLAIDKWHYILHTDRPKLKFIECKTFSFNEF